MINFKKSPSPSLRNFISCKIYKIAIYSDIKSNIIFKFEYI